MKPRIPTNGEDRFSGSVRHYHRSGAKPQRSWDEWVDGDLARTGRARNWPKAIGIILGVLALVGIIVGLMVELR
jgi:glucose uptake protein GlcU